jgi:DNA repair protein RadC
MSIHLLPADARPREKLLARGAGALADAELLAILLRTGIRGQGVLQMAEALLERFGALTGLLNADAEALKAVKGLGPAKRAELAAVLELARRAVAGQLKEQPVLADPLAVGQYLQLHLAHRKQEVFGVMFLDVRGRLLAFEELFQGTLTRASVYPREVVIRALKHSANSVVLAHNHPSGDARPSAADEALTQNLKSALHLVDVRLLDHVIVSQGQFCSMAQLGLL